MVYIAFAKEEQMTGKFTNEIAKAYDELSILEVKLAYCEDLGVKKKLQEDIEFLKKELNENIGYDSARKIYNSEFYKKLFAANLDIFIQIRENPSNNDFLNLKRFAAKQALQKEFFKEEMKEIKI